MDSIGLASDHAGYIIKCAVHDFLKNKGYQVIDYGCNSIESCDYTIFGHLLGDSIDSKIIQKGFVFCGSGNGINMTINKHQSVRSALCWNSTIASLARHHNDANVCSIPARFVSDTEVFSIIEVFLNESFDGGRHLNRVQNIPVKL